MDQDDDEHMSSCLSDETLRETRRTREEGGGKLARAGGAGSVEPITPLVTELGSHTASRLAHS